jgi:hypothetical protein
MPAPKTGPLTRAELLEVWKGATDKAYHQPLITAGDGNGLEAWNQLFEQFARVSKAIDVTTQAMFIRPSSAQSNPPSAGGSRATVTLTIARTKRINEPLLFAAGPIFILEETTDASEGGGVTVRTGRRYVLKTDLFFAPGEKGPLTVVAEAEREGYGYNNPFAGTIKAVEQNGSFFANNLARVTVTTAPVVLNGPNPSSAIVRADNQPDMFIPDHVGQYAIFTAGANIGKVGRVSQFLAPSLPLGSGVALELLSVFSVTDEITGYNPTNVSGDIFLSSTQNLAAGPSFQGDGSTLGGATFLLKKTGAPTGNIVAKVYALTGSWTSNVNTPVGLPLATSDPIDSSTLSTNYEEKRFTFSGANQIVLTGAANFAVVIEYTGGNASNNVGVGADTTAPSYLGFTTRFFSLSWSALAADACFILHRKDVGDYAKGETISFTQTGSDFGYGRVVDSRIVNGVRRVAFIALSGIVSTMMTAGVVATGLQSGASYVVWNAYYTTSFTTEAPIGATGGASWRILDWVEDWGLSVTNDASPENGRSAMLDELGFERAIQRASGEGDESYRGRVAAIADVVSPNAIRRSLNRSLGAYPWCFREVGSKLFRGFFFDGDSATPSATPGRFQCDAYDYDTISITGSLTSGTFRPYEKVYLEETATFNVRAEGVFGRIDSFSSIAIGMLTLVRKKGASPSTNLTGYRVRGVDSGAIWTCSEEIENRVAAARRWRTLLDIEQFRAFFLAGVPTIRIGEFGIAYDAGRFNAYDAAPFSDFYDGNAFYRAAPIYQQTHQAIESIRAGGVGFELYQENEGCVEDNPTGEPVYLVNPSAMGGLVGQWESFAGLTLDGSSNVQAWVDQSGNGWDWGQLVGVNRPTTLAEGSTYPTGDSAPIGAMRRRALIFDGSRWLESARKTFPSNWTLVFLGFATTVDVTAPVTAGNVKNTVFGDNDAGSVSAFGFEMGTSVAQPMYRMNGTSTSIDASAATQAMQGLRMFVVADGVVATNARYSADGLPLTTSLLSTFASAGVNRLGTGKNNTDGFKGLMFGAMVFNRQLTPKELMLLYWRYQYLYF